MPETLKKGVKMFLRSSKHRMNIKSLKNVFSLGCPKKNVKNTKMQFKKNTSSPN